MGRDIRRIDDSTLLNGWTDEGELYMDSNGLPAYKGSKVWIRGQLWKLLGYADDNYEYIKAINADGEKYLFLVSALEKLPVNFEWS